MVSMTAALFVFSHMTLTLGRPSVTRSEMVVRDEHPSVPKGYSAGGDAPLPGDTLRLTLAMPQTNMSGLHAALMDVSDPASDSYGRHLSKAEVQALVAPSQDSVQAVTKWLGKNGISSKAASPSGDMLTLDLSVSQANTLLGANFKTYVHDQTNVTMYRTLAYSLPASVSDHIAFIYPTTQFIAPIKSESLAPVQAFNQTLVKQSKRRLDSRSQTINVPDELCGQVVTPGCLQKMYNIPSTPATAPGNSIAVSSFGDENATPPDLQTFLSETRPDIKDGSFTVQHTDGFVPPNKGTIEASLDVQYVVGLATGVPASLVTVNTSDSGSITMDKFIDMANYLLEMDEPPLVFSTSYGFNEPANNTGFTQLATTLCNLYAQLGARGVSVIYASGDSGVAGTFMNNPANCSNSAFVPTFPASCPYVTAVGSTTNQGPETAASFSSGGFSNIFPRPSYQDGAVTRYIDALGDTYKGRYNASGRAVPDVSTQGSRFVITINGQTETVSGTSASAPTFASVISLLNDELSNAGRRPLGFLNPMLYTKGAAALNDITQGSNPGCGTDGFAAGPGWDPVTGLGTPDYNKLVKAVTGSPSVLAKTSHNWATRVSASGACLVVSLLVSLVTLGL